MTPVGDTPSRRADQRRQTGERIRATAIELFQRHGFEHVTVNAIAKAAGVSVPTFYAHFSSREALLMPLPTREEVAAVFATQPAHLPAADRARGVIITWLETVGRLRRDEVLERWRIIATTPSLRLRTAEFERATAALVLEVLRAENGGKDLAPAVGVAVNALMSAYTSIVLRWADDDGARDLAEIAHEVLAELRDQL
jgi:AcrR family transcriptional regulator